VISWLETNWLVFFTSVASALATLGLSYRFFAEKLFGHFFDRRLEAFKHERARELEQLKHEKNQEIEQLRAAIAHISDRGQHSNEREYEALSKMWEKAVDLYYATNTCVIMFVQYPSLNSMPAEEVKEFLNSTEFSEPQKRSVLESSDKERSFSHIAGRRAISGAQGQYFETNSMLHKLGIFIPNELYDLFNAFGNLCSSAIAQRSTEHGSRFRTGLKHDSEFLTKGPGMLEQLKAAVRKRLLRD
jgi:hypothetical protein